MSVREWIEEAAGRYADGDDAAVLAVFERIAALEHADVDGQLLMVFSGLEHVLDVFAEPVHLERLSRLASSIVESLSEKRPTAAKFLARDAVRLRSQGRERETLVARMQTRAANEPPKPT